MCDLSELGELLRGSDTPRDATVAPHDCVVGALNRIGGGVSALIAGFAVLPTSPP